MRKEARFIYNIENRCTTKYLPTTILLNPILAGNSERIFSIDRVTSVLYMTAPVDFEVTREHVLIVRKVSLKSGTSSEWQPLASSTLFHVNIEVVDENDNAPAFVNDPVLFSVSEKTRIGMTVYTLLNATDADTGANGRIRLGEM